jgi:adenosylcobinamide kinase / adenosylcobinamide-phosphate guanylyltransferase
MAKELILVLGGARSGKSTYAQQAALDMAGPSVLYVATAEALDDEMRARIAVHQSERPTGWRTLEAPRLTGQAIAGAAGSAGLVVVDCLTLLVSNTVLSLGDDASTQEAEQAALAQAEALLDAYRAGHATWIVVSNEVGLGVVPPYALGRSYRDALGRANQRLAAAADRVLFMVAGLPMRLK